jgi:hypothetical protein
VLASSIVAAGACAARDARPADSGKAAKTEPPTVQSRYREMTWPEYYREVTERVWKRGGTVVWISPPHVRKAKRSDTPAVER